MQVAADSACNHGTADAKLANVLVVLCCNSEGTLLTMTCLSSCRPGCPLLTVRDQQPACHGGTTAQLLQEATQPNKSVHSLYSAYNLYSLQNKLLNATSIAACTNWIFCSGLKTAKDSISSCDTPQVTGMNSVHPHGSMQKAHGMRTKGAQEENGSFPLCKLASESNSTGNGHCLIMLHAWS
eukprot:GHRR01026916.1.p1 GENE.GHRR01026916.1~~GHRR01026916.1.p1  ORF type:complete len:182 (-),score=27.75 GHRR01026916.1:1242-1787(-)